MELLEGREYAYATISRFGFFDTENVQRVRIIRVRDRDVMIKTNLDEPKQRTNNLSTKIAKELRKSYPGFRFGTPEPLTVPKRSLICLWEDWPTEKIRLVAEFDAMRARNHAGGRRGSKPRRGSKWRGLSKPGAPPWEESTKETRISANRRDRHQTKTKLHNNLKKYN